jgi:hypothetical protein
VIAAFGAWSAAVWGARLVNIWRDVLLSTDEKVALSVIALIFVGLGLVVLVIGIGLRRWAVTRPDVVAIGVLGGWTVGVWVLRTIDIVRSSELAGGDEHGAAFVVVHGVLALGSIALAALAWRAVSGPASGRQSPADSIAPAMGQPVHVLHKPSSTPGVLRFETNRNLTGMGKEIYRSIDDVVRDRPPDVLAKRLFEAGGVSGVTVYGGVINVQADDSRADALQKVIEDLYLFYQPGDPPQMVTE